MPGIFYRLFSHTKMSELSRSDIKTLALCLYDDPTSHDANHNKTRLLIDNIPNNLRDFRFSSILAEPRHAVKLCPVHNGIAPLVVSRLFTSIKSQVNESLPLLKRYGLYLGPEETLILEKMITIEGMWSPPTARQGPTKMRYWDYQVDKCQACMVSRVASDGSALRDMRTLILSGIDSSAKSSDPRLLPNHPTILSFINEWISLTSRSDELFYWSGIQAASIKEVKRMVEGTRTATPRCSGGKNFFYPQPPRSYHTSTDSSFQSPGIFTPTRTPGSPTSSKESSTFEWSLLKRYQLSGSTSTITPAFTRHREPEVSFSSQSSNCVHFLPMKQPCTQTSGAYSNAHSNVPTSPHSTHSFPPLDPEIERDTRTPRPPPVNPEDEHDRRNSVNSSRSSHASFMSFIRRAAASASPPPPSPPLPPPRRMDLPRVYKPVARWENSEASLGYRTSSILDESFFLANTSNDGEQGLRGQQTQPATTSTTTGVGEREAEAEEYEEEEEEEEEEETPLISRWSVASSVNRNTWSTLLRRTRGPRLGKVTTGRAIFKAGSYKDGNNRKT